MRMAGAMIRDAVRNGRLELEDGDIQELQRGLIAVADQPGQPWFAEGSHGTAEQRNEAFSLDTTARWMRASSDM